MTAPGHDLVTLGESMWRLSAPGVERLATARTLDVNIGGAESNVAIALARLGKRVAWWSRLPRNPLAENLLLVLSSHGVDTSGVRLVEDDDARLGAYFIEFGSAPRPTRVIYDRADSAASRMQPEDFDWSALRRARRLHLTGITPALGPSCLETVRHAIAEGRRAGTHITLDLNYREKLWSWDECRPVIDELAAACNLFICAARDARHLLRVGASTEAAQLAHQLYARWRGPAVALTDGARDSLAHDGRQLHRAAAFAGGARRRPHRRRRRLRHRSALRPAGGHALAAGAALRQRRGGA